jgi:hypothetical protein
MGVGGGLTVVLSELGRTEKEVTAMDENNDDKWLTRQDLADRYGLPVKTPAQWASKGNRSALRQVRPARALSVERRS